MAIYILLEKIKEDNEWVSYVFKMDIVINLRPASKNLPRKALKRIQGTCVFNKKTEEFKALEDETHPYFFKHPSYLLRVHVKLIRINCSDKEFSPLVEIAS